MDSQIVRSTDIILLISFFISDIKDLVSWKSTCNKTYNLQYTTDIICDRYYDGIISTNLDLSKYISYPNILPYVKRYGNKIKSLTCMQMYIDLSFLKNLTYLDCNGCKISDKDIRYLTKLKTLKCGRNTLITSKGLNNLKELTYLDCDMNPNIDDDCNCNLKYLHVGYSMFTDNILFKLVNLTHLICRFDSKFTDEGLKHLVNLQHLECRGDLSDNGLKYLYKLKYLNCGSSHQITLKNIQLTNLTYLNCGDFNRITDESLKNLTNLTHLLCNWNDKITDEGISHLPKLIHLHCGWNKNNSISKCPKQLKYLHCGFNTAINDNSFQEDSCLIYLHTIHTRLNINDNTISKLKFLQCLYLNFDNTISDYCIENHPSLKHISCVTKKYAKIQCNDCICSIKLI